ncbi:MAG: carboxypeptidase regulatory-like domain-containing protein, partial [Acidobacteriaceae bacterium]|nr:carboxypeptidase regulatory-like domain-containing protein [Acidobacteriaceae bacterium]
MWAVLAAALLLIPAAARAQSAIAGTVKDTSGAVLPGVTVEASSDVLIEKSRAVVTDGSGNYKIVDLRPGSYVVTFSLPGFQTVKRENIDLPAEFTASINADMKVGSLEETITVTTAAPTVDVQSAAHVQTLDRDAIDNLPTGRTIQGLGQMIVGVSLSLPDVGGSRAAMQTYMSVRGNSAANNTVMIDGMVVNGLELNGAVQSYFNDAMSQEMSYQTSGIDASVSSGGVKLNMIPKDGGNRFSGSSQLSYRPGAWQGDNLTSRLKTAGLAVGNSTQYIYDLNGTEGGPIVRDKLWFFATARDNRTSNGITNTFFQDGSKGTDYNYIRDALGRATYQLSSKVKLSGHYDRISKYRGHDMQSLTSPEQSALIWTSPNYSTSQIKMTATLTNRLMFDAGWTGNIEKRNTSMQPGIAQDRNSAAWYAGAAYSLVNTTLGGVSNSSATAYGAQWPVRYSYNTSLSYITGSHNLKGGLNGTYGSFYHSYDANADLYQEYANVDTSGYLNGTGPLVFTNPVSVVIRNTPIQSGEMLSKDMGIYVQDTWTLRRMTVNAGIRYEWLNSGVQGYTAPAGRFVPARTVPTQNNLPAWSDPAPRFQVVYDLFGNSKTAIKYSANRYNAAQTTTVASGFNTLSSVTARLPWVDKNGDNIAQGSRTFDANGNPIICDFVNDSSCEIDMRLLPSNFGM